MNIEGMAQRYMAQMREIKGRVAVLREMTASPAFDMDLAGIRQIVQLEGIALQLRKVLELLVFSSLVANQNRLREMTRDGSLVNFHYAKKLLAQLEILHPEFFPLAGDVTERGPRTHISIGHLDAFTKDDFIELYDLCSDRLHVWNPFRAQEAVIDWGRPITEWVDRIENLLRFHVVCMWGGDRLLCTMSDERKGGDVSLTLARPQRTLEPSS